MKETVIEQFSRKSDYDRKHINNLSDKVVPQAVLDSIEQGCSLEALEQAAKDFTICKYETQITIHGIFDKPKTNYVGGYKNLIQNKNKSLGVRWSAIDVAKKARLYETLAIVSGWRIERDSTKFLVCKSYSATTKDEALAKHKELKAESEKIDTSLFVGEVGVNVYVTLWGSYLVKYVINIRCFYEKNTTAILDNITGMSESERAARISQYKAEKAAKRAEWEKKCEESRAQAKAKEEQIEKARAQWQEANPLPANYTKHSGGYDLQVGDVITFGIVYNLDKYSDTPKFGYEYYLVSKSFGRFIFTNCTSEGVKLKGKGTGVNYTTVKRDVWVMERTTPDKPKANQTTAKTETVNQGKPEQATATKQDKTTATAKIKVVSYSDKAWAVVGDTKPFANKFKAMGGRFNPHLTCGAGWVFSKRKASDTELLAVAK